MLSIRILQLLNTYLVESVLSCPSDFLVSQMYTDLPDFLVI